MIKIWLSIGLAAVALGGCVHYAPAPVTAERYPAELAARRLDAKPPGLGWTGADLLSAALANNAQVAAAKANYLTAVAAARTAKLSSGLTLILTGEYANQAPTWGHSASADVPLDAGARRQTRITTADLQALQAWYDYVDAVWSVRTAIAKARVELVSSGAEMGLAQSVADLRRERVRRLEQRVAAGEDDRSLALTAQAELASAERRLTDARGRHDLALVNLAKGLGVTPSAVAGIVVDTMAPPSAPDSPPALRNDAALHRGDVLRAVAAYDIAENALRAEVAKQYPQISISPGYNYDHGVTKLPLSVNLALPTWDLNRRAIEQAEAGRAAAGRALEAVQADALAAVDTASATLITAQSAAERMSAVDLPAARRATQNIERSLKAGEADRVDDLGAKAAEREAELNLLDAQRTGWTAISDLEDALKRSFDPAEDAVLKAALTRPVSTR
jgi:CRISPR system Cascade subunit CasA